MKNPNIIFIVLDALRADSLSCYGFKKRTSPNIDSLAENGIIFNKAFCCINSTDPAFTSIITGAYPQTTGILHHGLGIGEEEIKLLLTSNIKFIQEILKQKGYVTYGLDWLGRWHKRGYDYYHSSVSINKVKRLYAKIYKIISKNKFLCNLLRKLYHSQIYRIIFKKNEVYNDGTSITKKAISIINKNTNKNFYIFLHYWDTHRPYNCKKQQIKKFYSNYTNLNEEEVLNSLTPKFQQYYKNFLKSCNGVNGAITRYYASINYADLLIGKIIEALKKTNQFGDTLIIVTADHGESLTEHNIFFDHHGLYDVSTNIPLILHYPRLFKKNKINSFVQSVDILPTILDILKIKKPDYVDGESLLSLIFKEKKSIRNYALLEETHDQEKIAYRTQRYKYIKSKGKKVCEICGVIHGGEFELYDSKKDPGEKNNIYSKNKKTAKEIETKLNTLLLKLQSNREKNRIKSIISEIKI